LLTRDKHLSSTNDISGAPNVEDKWSTMNAVFLNAAEQVFAWMDI